MLGLERINFDQTLIGEFCRDFVIVRNKTYNVQVGDHQGEEAAGSASEAQEVFSQASSPGPDMAALSPLTPQVFH